MDAEFSEFSYGFAATAELADRLRKLKAAPVFPSLLKEAKLGWDVKLQSRAGVVVFVQFKTPEALTMASAREWPLYNNDYFRIYIRRLRHSNQHNLLKALAQQERFVYYLAPRFFELDVFDQTYTRGRVLENSVSFPLLTLPWLNDDDQHYICFRTGADARWCSQEPERTKALSAQHMPEEIVENIRPGDPVLTLARLRDLRTVLLELAGRSALSHEMGAAPPTYSRIAHDIEYLSRTLLSAETLFVTRTDDQN